MVKIISGTHSDSATTVVKSDPRIDVSIEALKAKSDYLDKILSKVEIATKAADRIRAAEKTVRLIEEKAKEKEGALTDSLKKESKTVKDSLKSLMALIIEPEIQGLIDNPNNVNSRLSTVYEYVNSSFEAPGKTADAAMLLANEKLEETLRKINDFFENSWKQYQEEVSKAGITFFDEYKPLEF